jgi:pyridoxine 4-dehydrogenase
LLTGKYTPDSPPAGIRRYRYRREKIIKVKPLLDLMAGIGRSRGGKSLSQIALNWTMCKGTVPIPGAKNIHQATENAGALGWRLTSQEIALLDQISEQLNNS